MGRELKSRAEEATAAATEATEGAAATTTTATAAATTTQEPQTSPIQENKSAPQVPEKTLSDNPKAAKHSRSAELLSRCRRLLAENRELKRRQLCRQCRDTAANVTLLPCGHLLYCQDCASDQTHCQLCHREIMADIKTYLC
ncbi:hypothetical protein ACOMHN_004902 [Nucella lapillus]